VLKLLSVKPICVCYFKSNQKSVYCQPERNENNNNNMNCISFLNTNLSHLDGTVAHHLKSAGVGQH